MIYSKVREDIYNDYNKGNFGKHYAKITVQVLTEHLAEKQAPIAISTNGKEKNGTYFIDYIPLYLPLVTKCGLIKCSS